MTRDSNQGHQMLDATPLSTALRSRFIDIDIAKILNLHAKIWMTPIKK